MKRRNHHGYYIAELINQYNFERVAEIGVCNGATTIRVLEECKYVKEYWGIDIWKEDKENKGYGKLAQLTQDIWTKYYLNVCKLMLYFPNFKIIRETSLQASRLFPLKYFDLVFIDADHSYEAVLSDIEQWLPRVRPRGLLTGHDFENRHFPGVKKAVQEKFGNDIKVYTGGIWLKEV